MRRYHPRANTRLHTLVDLWEPYHLAVRAALPNAQISGDRFHVMKNLTERVSVARREIQREAPKEVRPTSKAAAGCW